MEIIYHNPQRPEIAPPPTLPEGARITGYAIGTAEFLTLSPEDFEVVRRGEEIDAAFWAESPNLEHYHLSGIYEERLNRARDGDPEAMAFIEQFPDNAKWRDLLAIREQGRQAGYRRDRQEASAAEIKPIAERLAAKARKKLAEYVADRDKWAKALRVTNPGGFDAVEARIREIVVELESAASGQRHSHRLVTLLGDFVELVPISAPRAAK